MTYENGSCTGKEAYISPNEAHAQLEHRRRRKRMLNKRNRDERVYKCKFCKFWHIGRFH